MSMLQGCSELQETVRLVAELLQARRRPLRSPEPAPLRPVPVQALAPLSALAALPGAPVAPAAAAAPLAAPAAVTAPVTVAEPVAALVALPLAVSMPVSLPVPAAVAAPVVDFAALADCAAVATQMAAPAAVAAPAPAPLPEEAPRQEPPRFAYRGDRLEHVLASLCERGGLSGAVVADGKGLPLADYKSPVGGDALAAFTSVLGGALERAGIILGAEGADLISMDLNYTEKVVLRRFALEGDPYFLMVICSQDLDERTEVELSIEQVTAILSEN